MKLNLGCGNVYAPGWVNVDNDTPHRIDQRVDLNGPLPWTDVTHIYAGHLFEHITPEQCSDLLERLLACTAGSGALLVAVGPDIDVADKQVADGTYDYGWGHPDLLRNGAGRWAGDVHLWETTGPKVARLIRAAGWPVVNQLTMAQLDDSWPVADRGPTWQYVVRAWAGDMDQWSK